MPHRAVHSRELLRECAERLFEIPPEWLIDVDAAVLTTLGNADPAVRDRVHRSNRLHILHWASSIVRSPDLPVLPNLSPEMIEAVAARVRRDTADSVRRAFHAGVAAAWPKWLEIVFTVTSDPEELRPLLNLSMRSISEFVDATIADVLEQAACVRDEGAPDPSAERFELVRTILDGQPTDVLLASLKLAYRLDQAHQTVIVWTTDPAAGPDGLTALADQLVAAMKGRPALRVSASRTEIWLWLPRALTADLILPGLDAGLRVALGPWSRGLGGFRSSHAGARVAQRLLAEFRGGPPVLEYEVVRLMSVISQDHSVTRGFVTEVLGDLSSASEELRQSLLTYLELGCNVGATATRLGIHRNTLLRQIGRARDVLPIDLDGNRIEIAVALRIAPYLTER